MHRIDLRRLNAPETRALLEQLKEDTINYCYAHGIQVVSAPEKGGASQAPHALLPMPLPRSAYTLALSLAPTMNLLYDRVARDTDFISKTLAASAKTDSFIRNLLAIHKRLYVDQKPAQELTLCINRSDYMLHYDDQRRVFIPQQVEMNMISSSFACLSTRVYDLHKFLMNRHIAQLTVDTNIEAESKEETEDSSVVQLDASALPKENNPGKHIVESFVEAVKLYQTHFYPKVAQTPERLARPFGGLAILMVVQERERNAVDQRHLEYGLYEGYGIPVIRRSLGELATRAQVDPETNQLYVDGQPIAIVYYRAGYTPNDFTEMDHPEKSPEWIAMERMEKTIAIKCPTVAHHLAGTKKVQQALAQPGVTEQYLNAEDAAQVRKVFTGLWGLENEDEVTQAIIREAIAQPGRFVLKPQREGGGNNLWGDELVHTLKTADLEQRSAYILMSKIEAKTRAQAAVRQGELTLAQCLSELGIFGTMISGSAEGFGVIQNKAIGHLLRTKFADSNEGGVNAGYAVLDTPILYE